MTVRDLIKELEVCDLDKQVHLIISVLSDDKTSASLLLREIVAVIENEDLVGIQ
jgi:hypothetical protein